MSPLLGLPDLELRWFLRSLTKESGSGLKQKSHNRSCLWHCVSDYDLNPQPHVIVFVCLFVFDILSCFNRTGGCLSTKILTWLIGGNHGLGLHWGYLTIWLWLNMGKPKKGWQSSWLKIWFYKQLYFEGALCFNKPMLLHMYLTQVLPTIYGGLNAPHCSMCNANCPPPAAWVNRVHGWGMYIYQKTPHQPPYTWPKFKGYTLR